MRKGSASTANREEKTVKKPVSLSGRMFPCALGAKIRRRHLLPRVDFAPHVQPSEIVRQNQQANPR